MIKAYFFDLFGTLADYRDKDKIKKFGEENIFREHHDYLLATKIRNYEFSEKYIQKIIEWCNMFDQYLYEDSWIVIEKLKKNYKLGLISNIYEQTKKNFIEKFGNFLKNFNIVIFSSEVGIIKPDPEIFYLALNNLNVKPEEVIMIGDKAHRDIEPALKIGMQARLIDRKTQTLEDVI